jgi:hypothetical protein
MIICIAQELHMRDPSSEDIHRHRRVDDIRTAAKMLRVRKI